MKTGSFLAFVVFVMVAFAHLIRLVYGAEVTVDDTVVPMWVSIAGLVVPAGIAFLLWKESSG